MFLGPPSCTVNSPVLSSAIQPLGASGRRRAAVDTSGRLAKNCLLRSSQPELVRSDRTPSPTRFPTIQFLSRCCRSRTCPVSARLIPQPSSTAKMHGRACLDTVPRHGLQQPTALLNGSTVSQLPMRHPSFFAPFTLRMPAATFALSTSSSNLRTASIRSCIIAM